MNSADELIEMMTQAGVSSSEAERHAENYIRGQKDNEMFEKSINALEEVAEAQRAAEDAHQERLYKAFDDGQSSVAEALAPALDSLLSEQRAQNEALCKGLTGALELIKSLKSDIKALQNVQPEAPALLKSVNYLPSPADQSAVQESDVSRDQLFKSLSELSTSSPERAGDLMKAAALLEGGVEPSTIKQQFNL